MKRDITLDNIRGLAIFLMVQANIAGSVFAHPYPTWMQTYIAIGSFVPALFVLIAGMMVAHTSLSKGYTLKHYILRSVALLAAAALVIDVFILEIVPFIGFEILYLIAIALPLAYLFQRLNTTVRWLIILMIFAATPLLQMIFGYSPQPLLISIFNGTFFADIPGQTNIINHWFVDGWFPIFPWLGFAFLGVNLGIMRFKKGITSFASKKIILWGALALVSGILLWTFYPILLYVRQGFSETIYPPTLAYSITSIGQILLLLAFLDWKPNFAIYKPLRVLGESSLFIYIVHFVIIDLLGFFPSLTQLLLLAAGSLLLLFTLAYLLRFVRKKWKKRPFYIRYIFGI